jgi:hypothetical protein
MGWKWWLALFYAFIIMVTAATIAQPVLLRFMEKRKKSK